MKAKKMNKWQTWHIAVALGRESLRSIPDTVKARNEEEAAKKAARFLAGRAPLFRVFLPNVSRQESMPETSAVATEWDESK